MKYDFFLNFDASPYGIPVRTEMLHLYLSQNEKKTHRYVKITAERRETIRIKKKETITTTLREIISTKPHTKER